jgi:hypothetical protein
MDTKKCQKMPKKYYCEICDFVCSKESNYSSHAITPKHLKNTQKDTKDTKKDTKKCQKMPKKNETYLCACGKIYKYHSGLWRHKNKSNCDYMNDFVNNCDDNVGDNDDNDDNDNGDNKKDEIKILTNLVIEIVKSNSDLHKQMIDVCKNTIITNSNSNTTINNSNNNSNNKIFNLQLFLNEKCKNAMNLSDFIDSIKLQMSDLENIGKVGYTEGMYNIIFNEITDIELFNRPFHCSDLKREIFYIKNENKWEKEDGGNNHLKNAIRSIEKKNFKLLNEWAEQHPKINDYNSSDGDKYLKLMSHATSGDIEHMNKVIKKLAKNITIDKNNL